MPPLPPPPPSSLFSFSILFLLPPLCNWQRVNWTLEQKEKKQVTNPQNRVYTRRDGKKEKGELKKNEKVCLFCGGAKVHLYLGSRFLLLFFCLLRNVLPHRPKKRIRVGFFNGFGRKNRSRFLFMDGWRNPYVVARPSVRGIRGIYVPLVSCDRSSPSPLLLLLHMCPVKSPFRWRRRRRRRRVTNEVLFRGAPDRERVEEEEEHQKFLHFPRRPPPEKDSNRGQSPPPTSPSQKRKEKGPFEKAGFFLGGGEERTEKEITPSLSLPLIWHAKSGS